MSPFRLAWREILNHRKFTISFSLTLAFGLFGLVAIGFFRETIDESLSSRSKEMLTADLAISGRRALSEREIKIVDDILGADKVSQSNRVNLYSMIASETESRLVELNVIETGFPLYGEMILKNKTPMEKLYDASNPKVFVYPEILQQLKTDIGKTLKIGTIDFTIADVIEEDAGSSWGGVGLAPRIYLGVQNLESTGLIRKGSTAWRTNLYKLPTKSNADKFAETINNAIDDPGIRVRSHSMSSKQQATMLNYLNDYLGLTSLVAFFLAAVGVIFLYRSYLQMNLNQFAILVSLGMKPVNVLKVGFAQIFILGIFASILSTFFGLAVIPMFLWIANDLLPLEFAWHPPWESLFFSFAIGSVGSILICLPLLMELPNIKPSRLFTGEKKGLNPSPLKTLLYCIPGLLFFWLLGVKQANSWIIGNLFTVGFLGASFILASVCVFLLWMLAKSMNSFSLNLKLASRSLVRNKIYSVFCFLAISLTAFLVNTIPMLQKSLLTGLENPNPDKKLPSFFMFDIQEEQVSDIERIAKEKDAVVERMSPLIRARLQAINGVPFEKETEAAYTREQERAKRMRNRGFNLTYRKSLDWSETIVEGRPYTDVFDTDSGKPAEVSVEKRFAERLNIKVGDLLIFDIGGVPVEGKIVNLRRVKWTSFSPNFFVQFQPGVLEAAPKTFVATIGALEEAKKPGLQDAIVSNLPNVSVIDVSRLVDKIKDLVSKMTFALQIMAILTAFSGLLVLFAIVRQATSRRRYDIALLKSLGSKFQLIRNVFLSEFLILVFGAAAFGTSLSILLSYLLAKFAFDGIWVFDFTIPMTTITGFFIVSFIIVLLALRQALQAKAVELLQEG